MPRSDADGCAANTGSPVSCNFTLTLSGTNRLLYAFYVAQGAVNNANRRLDTLVVGSNTVYELGVDTSRKIGEVDFADPVDHRIEIIRVFDTDLPTNGDVLVTFTCDGSTVARMSPKVAFYTSADQTTGHRGAPVTYAPSSPYPTSWDLTSISNDTSDIETLCFIAWISNTNTEDADNPVISPPGEQIAGSTMYAEMCADTTSRANVGGDWSGTPAQGAWAASIMASGEAPGGTSSYYSLRRSRITGW